MLQQTQVRTVIPYFQRFMQTFPKLNQLANADLSQVLHHWSGLGYYARARNLHKAAQITRDIHHGQLPNTLEGLMELPGIGRSTAGAILSLGMDQYGVILDGNVKRVLCRYLGISGWPGQASIMQQLWALSEQATPKVSHAIYNQGMMDLGATLCTRSKPKCSSCPLRRNCYAHNQSCVDQIPAPKPKLTRPTQTEYLLVLLDKRRRVLMSQRPPEGLWGGLWSFPQFPTKAKLFAFCAHYLSEETNPKPLLKPFKHQFTHFTMQVTTYQIELNTQSLKRLQAVFAHYLPETNTATLWYDVFTPPELGLSSMASRILTQVRKQPHVASCAV